MQNLILYHGTRKTAAAKILKSGFRRSAKQSYTGTGVNLSESLTVSYPYGEYENGGAVLEVTLRPDTVWADQSGTFDTWRHGFDAFFKAHPATQAVRTYGGNVWIVWNLAAIASVRLMSHREALKALHAEIVADGPDMGYNGIVQDYASTIFGSPDRNLDRFPADRASLAARLAKSGISTPACASTA
jgi:hypothetical protein